MICWMDPKHGVCEASDIGFPPGEFPVQFDVEGLHLVRGKIIYFNHEVVKVEYNVGDLRVEVYND